MKSLMLALSGGVLSLSAGIALSSAVPEVAAVAHRALAAVGLLDGAPGKAAAKPSAQAGGPSENPADAHAEDEDHGGTIMMPAEMVVAQEITLAKVSGGTLARHLLVPGTVTTDADRIARVPARVVGTVAEMRKRLGDAVRKGDVVAVLDSREVADAKSEYLTAQVQAELQTINFERQQKLLGSQATSVLSFDQARASYRDTQLRQDLARQKLSALGLDAQEVAAAAKRDESTPDQSSLRLYPLRASLSGRIVERKVDVGTRVGSEGDPADLYTVADLSSVWVELAVPTTGLAQVREGARVAILPGQDDASPRAEGRVVFVSPMLNADTRSARVIVALPNADQRWRPGVFVTAEIEIARDRVPVLVPRAAVQTIGDDRVVFVRTPEGFTRRAVQVGRADDDALEITEGLTDGEEIAVRNTFLLKAELGKSEAAHDD